MLRSVKPILPRVAVQLLATMARIILAPPIQFCVRLGICNSWHKSLKLIIIATELLKGIGCTVPGFRHKFMPFMNQPPGSLLCSSAVMT
jgi:hypothetical protein